MITWADIALLAAFFLSHTGLDVLHDDDLLCWKQGRSSGAAWHRYDALKMLLVGAGAGYLISGHWLVTLEVVSLFGAVRWLAFDAALNLLRGLPVGYVGEVADTDLLLRRLPTWMQWPVKVGFLALTLGALYLTVRAL